MLHVYTVLFVGMACRWRAASVLSKIFKSPHQADTHFSTMMQPSLEDASLGHTPSSYDDASMGHASSSQEDASHSASSGNSEIRAQSLLKIELTTALPH